MPYVADRSMQLLTGSPCVRHANVHCYSVALLTPVHSRAVIGDMVSRIVFM